MTDKWIKDTGIIIGLVFVIAGLRGSHAFLVAAVIFLLVTALIPKVLYPIAYVWLKVTEGLGLIIPKIFFGIVFFIVIVPYGLVRRLFGKDSLFIRRSYMSAFIERNHLFTRTDIEMPY